MKVPNSKTARNKPVSVAISELDYEMIREAADKNGRKPSGEIYARIRFTLDLFGTDDVEKAGAGFAAAKDKIQLKEAVKTAAEDIAKDRIPLVGTDVAKAAVGRRGLFGGAAPRSLQTAYSRESISSLQMHKSSRARNESGEKVGLVNPFGDVVGPADKPDKFYFLDRSDPEAYRVMDKVTSLQFDTDLILNEEQSQYLREAPGCGWDALSPLMLAYENHFDEEQQVTNKVPELRIRKGSRLYTAHNAIVEILETTINYEVVVAWDEVLDEVTIGHDLNPGDDGWEDLVNELASDAIEKIQGPFDLFKERYNVLWDWSETTSTTLN